MKDNLSRFQKAIDTFFDLEVAWKTKINLFSPSFLSSLSDDEIRDELSHVYELQTSLRRLKHRVRSTIRQNEDEFSKELLTKSKLMEHRKRQARWYLIDRDIRELSRSISQEIKHAEKLSGKVVFIYALIDPISEEVRYIGKTENPEMRLSEHINTPTNADMAAWIESLRKKNDKPEFVIIDLASLDDWPQKEANHIWQHRQMGYDLLNHAGPLE